MSDALRLFVIADTHGLHRSLELPPGDAIIHCGDFSHFGNKRIALDFITWYRSLDYPQRILTGGNHDQFAASEPETFRQLLGDQIEFLQDSGTTIGDLSVWGAPWQPNLEGWAFGLAAGAPMRQHWDLMPNDIDILITHTPPKGTLDHNRNGQSLGCAELTQKISEVQPQLHAFGHVHASYGHVERNGTTYINAAIKGSRTNAVRAPYVADFLNGSLIHAAPWNGAESAPT